MTYRFNGFTEKANNAMNLAISSAEELGHDYVGSEHVMLGLLKEGSGVAYTVLNKLGVTAEAYEKLIRERIGTGEPTSLSPDEFTPRTKRILQVAAVAGAQLHNAYVGTEHLLIAIIEDGQSYAMRFLQILGADPNRIVAELSNMLNNTGFHKQNEARPGGGEEGGQTGKALEQFGRDLTQLAAQGKIDPVIGRQNEIERVIQILCRRTKQPRAHRRARRGQNRRGRGLGPENPGGRGAGAAEEQAPGVPGLDRHGGRYQVPRRL